MNFNVSSLAAGLIFGVLGMFLIRRGKHRAHIPNVVIGLALIVYPYFIENDYLLWGIGGALLLLAYKLRVPDIYG